MEGLERAAVSEFDFDAKRYRNIRITERGGYLVPAEALAGEGISRRALEVVRVSVAELQGYYVLEARGSVVTTEMLSSTARLQIDPKFGFDPLVLLLSWSAQPILTLSDRVPVDVAPDATLTDVFALQFLAALSPVLRDGWIPAIRRRTVSLPDVVGDVDVVGSYGDIFAKGQLALRQTVNVTRYDVPANLVVKSALLALAGLGPRLSADLARQIRELLAATPFVDGYAHNREALAVCEDLLSRRALDPMRGYFYPALEAAVPILQALGRAQSGSPELEDVALRLEMPLIFESAVREVTAQAAGLRHHARKESDRRLYVVAEPPSFNPTLEPDIVIRRVGEARRCAAVLDVKYRERPSSGDHRQLVAYADAYGASAAAFVTLSDEPGDDGVVARATSASGASIFEYALRADDLRGGFADYAGWIQELLARPQVELASRRLPRPAA